MAGLIDYSIIKPELSNALAAGFQQSQERQRALAQQERQNKLADIQFRTAQRGEEEALAEREAYKRAGSVQQVPQELRAAGLGRQALAAEESARKRQAESIQRKKYEEEIGQSLLRRVYAEGTRQSVNEALAEAAALGIEAGSIKALFDRTPDADIKRIAFVLSEGPKAAEQQVIRLPDGSTIVEPKYAMPGMQAPAMAQPGAPSFQMPAGIPGQTPRTQGAGVNALALPPPVSPIAQGAMPTPTGGRYFPPSMTPQQQAAEARAQQQLGMERERLELSKEEATRKRAEVPSDTRKELTSIDQQRSVIDGALKAVKATPNAFSFARGAIAGVLPYGESLAGRTETPEQTQARAYVFNNVSRVINERAGAAQSAQEMQRLRSFLPADTDNAEQITNKLKGFQTYLQDLEKGTIKGTPPATKEALQKTRGVQLSDIDKQALEWASSNSGDPRAAQIKQRLGVQ